MIPLSSKNKPLILQICTVSTNILHHPSKTAAVNVDIFLSTAMRTKHDVLMHDTVWNHRKLLTFLGHPAAMYNGPEHGGNGFLETF
jgi:hypothetical protein